MTTSTITAPLPAAVAAIRADALLLLLRARPALLAWDLAEAAMAVLGLSRADMSGARARADHPIHPARPTTDRPWPAPPPPLRIVPRAKATVARSKGSPPPRAATVARPVDLNGRLRCSRCGDWFAPESFRLRTDRIGSGGRRSACDACHSRANANRYVSLDAKAALNAVGIVLSLEAGDAAARLRCVRCGQLLGTDDVTTGSVSLSHVTCPEEKNPG